MVSEGEVFPVPSAWAKRAHMDAAGYEAAVAQVEADPEAYWRKVAGRLDWITPPTQIKDTSFHKHPFHIRWY
ncbi:acetyl-coenzyme A synthetase N-terminal domain-containing protein, partial [Phenylobacterium sp.]|uniref:acetyl-coenzyme A synthetase N-terminal domain-containing protein n=2 Tax=Phenylobacterium sp. TaxID=1871053 RepID=UPI002FC760AC